MCIAMSYEENHFEIIIFNRKFKLFKRFNVNNNNISTSNKEIIEINDIFIMKAYLFVIINFSNLIIIDTDRFILLDFYFKEKLINHIPLNVVFKGDCRKVLYLTSESESNLNLQIYTKKEMKILKLKEENLSFNRRGLESNLGNLNINFMLQKNNKFNKLTFKYIWRLLVNLNLQEAKNHSLNNLNFLDKLLNLSTITLLYFFKSYNQFKQTLNIPYLFTTIKHSYFTDLNFSEVKQISKDSLKYDLVRVKYNNKVGYNLKRNLNLNVVFNPNKSIRAYYHTNAFNVTLSNNMFLAKYLVFLFKLHLFSPSYLKEAVERICVKKDERLSLLLYYKELLLKLGKGNSSSEQSEITFFKEAFKKVKKGSIEVFEYLRKYYADINYFKIVRFVLYCITENISLKSIYFSDIIFSIQENVSFEEIIKKYSPKKSKANFSFKNQKTVLYLNQLINVLIMNRKGLLENFDSLDYEGRVEFLFFLMNIQKYLIKIAGNSYHNTNNKLILSLDSEIPKSNSQNILPIVIQNLNKVISSQIIVIIGETKPEDLFFDKIALLFHIKLEKISFKKILINKIMSQLNENTQSLLKNFIPLINYQKIKEYSLKITDGSPKAYFDYLRNNTFNTDHFSKLLNQNKIQFQIINFICYKSKNKDLLTNLSNTNEKYSYLIDSIKQGILTQYLTFLVFHLIYLINCKYSDDLLIRTSKVFFILSIYFSLKNPDRAALFMCDIIETFYFHINNGDLNVEYIDLFFTFVDLTHQKKLKMLEEIKTKIKGYSNILYDRVINLNKDKIRFMNQKEPNFYAYLMNNNLTDFNNFQDIFIRKVSTQIPPELKQIKRKAREHTKSSFKMFVDLEPLICIKRFFNVDEKLIDIERNVKIKSKSKASSSSTRLYECSNSKNTLSDYSFDNSDSSNTSGISNNTIYKNINKSDIHNYQSQDITTTNVEVEIIKENSLKDKIIELTTLEAEPIRDTAYYSETIPNEIKVDEVMVKLKPTHVKEVHIPVIKKKKVELSYEDKKKKYIGLKLLIKLLNEKCLLIKKLFYRRIKSIFYNKRNEIEFTSLVQIKYHKK